MKNLVLATLILSSVSASTQTFSPAVSQFIVHSNETIAFENAIVIDGTGVPARAGQTVVVESGIITALGPAGEVAIPEDAEVIDMTGKTLLPGFVMMHEHMYYPAPAPDMYHVGQLSSTFPRLYLAGGATTIR
ncbi:MAG: hypothetical protein R3330_17345, partial [Saprospiraceae bacterium]|nr:hypothetical protein [Saprospiraceae bacterium]